MLVRLTKQISDWANWITIVVLIPLVALFFGVVFVAVVSRYVFNASIIESIELTRLAFNWSCFFGAAVAVKRFEHVRFVVLVDRLPALAQRVVAVFVWGALTLFFWLMIDQGWYLFERIRGTVFPALGWSQGLLYLSLPVSGAVMLIHGVAGLVASVADLVRPDGAADVGSASP